MFKIIFPFAICALATLSASLKDAQRQLYSTSVKQELVAPLGPAWTTDFEEGQKRAQKEQRPLLVAFVGLPWCPWSEKIQREVLSAQPFIETLAGRIVLVAHMLEEEKADSLKERFHISELPTLLLLDSEGKEIARMGYLPKSAEAFAAHVSEILSDFRSVKQSVSADELCYLSVEKLKELYLKAKEQGFRELQEKVYLAGLKVDDGLFFLLEQFRRYSERGEQSGKEALAVKKKILGRDPKNRQGGHRALALIEFEALSSRHSKKKKEIKAALEPLIAYVKKFGKEDMENLWRMELLIAQFLFRKNKAADALLHAKSAYLHAPEANKAEIVDTISYLETKLKRS